MVKIKVQYLTTTIDFEWNKEPLQETIESLFSKFNFHGSASDYILRNEASPSKAALTDQDISNPNFQLAPGSLLILKPSVNSVQKDLAGLNNPAQAKRVIFELRNHLQDDEFAVAFLQLGGLQSIVKFLDGNAIGNTLAYGLTALYEALKYPQANQSAELLPREFIAKRLIAAHLNSSNINVKRGILQVLSQLAASGTWGWATIDAAIRQGGTAAPGENTLAPTQPYAVVVETLGATDVTVQTAALALLNSLALSLLKNMPALNASNSTVSASDVRGEFRTFQETLEQLGLFRKLRMMVKNLQDESLKRQLFVHQALRLKRYQHLREEGYDKNNATHEAMLLKLWSVIYPTDPLKSRISEQWKAMGFQGSDPATDFRGMGLLGLHNLLYMAEHRTDLFKKLINGQHARLPAGHERVYPVAVAGINITQMLYDMLNIGKNIDPTGANGRLFKVLFDQPNIFEELYCLSFTLLDRTWDEMKANYMDFGKVLAAVRAQVEAALETQPLDLESLGRSLTAPDLGATSLSGSLGSSSLNTSSSAINAPSNFSDDTGDAPHMRAMKTQLRTEAVNMFGTQRAIVLSQGQTFANPAVVKGKSSEPNDLSTSAWLHLRVVSTELQYGAATSLTDVPRVLSHRLSKNEITAVKTGQTAVTATRAKKLEPEAHNRLLLVALKDGSHLELLASSRQELVNWADGLRVLIGHQIEERESFQELQKMVDIEVQVKLLDLVGITIPETQPPIPPPPSSFDFVVPFNNDGTPSV